MQKTVLKFGGTSVGSVERLRALVNLVHTPAPKIVVLSAMSGTTDALVAIAGTLHQNEQEKADQLITLLENKYHGVIAGLFQSEQGRGKAGELLTRHFGLIRSLAEKNIFSGEEEKVVLAQGELLSTALFHYYLEEQGIDSVLLPALEFMRTSENGTPDMAYIEKHLTQLLDQLPDSLIYITQGYICRNVSGAIDNLKRGGSDYTATIIGAAIKALEIQIWTDIDGMHNNDPRIVDNTFPIPELSFDESAELAYFGAKILHPTCILPAKGNNIPVRLLHTMRPEAKGTLISSGSKSIGIKAIAAKDGITAIKIKSERMLLAHGFLRAVFEIFERYKTAIDMITTSEVAVSLTIDDTTHLPAIIKALQAFCNVEVDEQLTIICIVGNMAADKEGYAFRVFQSLKHIPVRMISYGGSEHNISILVRSDLKKEALLSLNRELF